MNVTRNIFSSILSYGTYKLLAMICSILYVLVLAKILTAEELGIYYLVITILTGTMVLTRLGFDNLALKKISLFHDNSDIEKIQLMYAQIKKRILVSSFLGLISLSGLSYVISLYVLGSSIHWYKIVVISTCVYFYNMLFINTEVLKAINQAKLSVIIPGIYFPLINILSAVILYYFLKDLGIFISFVSSVIITYTISSYKISMIVGLSKQRVLNYDLLKLKIPWNFYLISLSNMIFASVDTLMLGIYSTTEEVGLYSLMLRVVLPFSTLLIIINNVFAREFSIMYSTRSIKEFHHNYNVLLRLGLILSIGYYIFLIFYGQKLMFYFGPSYVVDLLDLLVLSFGYLVLLSTGPSATALLMTGNDGVYRKVVLGVGLIGVFLSFFLIKHYGLFGACISSASTLIFKNTWSYYLVRKSFKESEL